MRYLFAIASALAMALTSACNRSGPTKPITDSRPADTIGSVSRKTAHQSSVAGSIARQARPAHRGSDSLPEGPYSETSAQGAANVVQTYAALVEAKKYKDAAALWEERSIGSVEEFARSFDRFREWHAEVGGPGQIEGAAGALYVQVPTRRYGRSADGAHFSRCGVATLRRVNNVPGSTAEQNEWHIIRIIDRKATGPCLEAPPTAG